jgi:hypothetical protein
MDPELKHNLSNTRTWGRALFMLLFAVIYSVAEIVLLTVTLFQFSFVLITRKTNIRLLKFGKELSTFVFQVFKFLTFNSDQKPFPFDSWPAMSDEEFDNLEAKQAKSKDDDEEDR